MSTWELIDDMKSVVHSLGDQDVFVQNRAAQALARAFYPNPNVEEEIRSWMRWSRRRERGLRQC